MRKKKTHLVCQHLEMISRKAVEDFQDVLKRFVKRRPGIYALYQNGRLCYVGLASNLKTRLYQHLHDRHAKSWDSFSIYLTIKSDHLRELEALAMRIAAPRENRQKGKLSKSQDLKRVFRRQVAARLKRDLNALFEDGGTEEIDAQALTAVVKGRRPALAGYFDRSVKIRLRYKGNVYRALVKRGGTVRYKKKVYNSPSLAAYAITKRPTNGWTWWQFERAPGDWVFLDELRK